MRVLEPNEPTISNHCIICGQGLDRQRMDIILDTGYEFDLPGTVYDGRKYVGQCCIWDIAKAAGLTTASQVADIKTYLRSYRNTVENIHESVIDGLNTALSRMDELPSAPNIDHLESPDHVLVAEAAAKQEKDWIAVPDDTEPPF